ncbi:hypothetical protein Y1Q_0015715 [Alligator mississippiensis]|uniref:Uncharacterized protein n=1 Tax=Alligator mississippiensis TaxID=8496 RepID=A0A151NNQ7_ALLMI|nr:hypothetical protein Y1Q_0015715 [Alligator mississippiensis]
MTKIWRRFEQQFYLYMITECPDYLERCIQTDKQVFYCHCDHKSLSDTLACPVTNVYVHFFQIRIPCQKGRSSWSNDGQIQRSAVVQLHTLLDHAVGAAAEDFKYLKQVRYERRPKLL